MENTIPKRGRGAAGTVRQRYLRCLSALLFAAALAFVCILIKSFLEGDFNSVESFREFIGRAGPLGPLLLTVFQALQVVIPVLPGFLGCAAGAAMFGPAVGFWCNYIGIAAGSIIAFFLARRYGLPLLQDLFPMERYRKWSVWAARSSSYAGLLFLSTLLPLFPDDFLCYLSGITEMSAGRFIRIIVLGKPWCILAYSLGFSLLQ